jgi:hypothetical protein
VWDKEYETLDVTCKNKFRKNGDVNQWVIKFWQMAKGQVSVRKDSFCYCYHIKETNFEALCKDIPSKRRKMLCINDTSKTENFEDKKERVKQAFEKLLPEKSSFEF